MILSFHTTELISKICLITMYLQITIKDIKLQAKIYKIQALYP